MNRGIYPALSGALAQERRMDISAHNLANLTTAGFKRDLTSFEAFLSNKHGAGTGALASAQSSEIEGAPLSQVSTRVFAMAGPTHTDWSPGQIRATGNPWDLAIEGEGYFEIRTPQGPRYTRNGTFHLNQQSIVVNQDGFPVMGMMNNKLSELKVPPGEATVDGTGQIMMGDQAVGYFRIVTFHGKQPPVKLGNNFVSGDAPVVTNKIMVLQRHLESSNVNATGELVDMISVQRSYEAMQKTIQAFDHMAQQSIQELGRTS